MDAEWLTDYELRAIRSIAECAPGEVAEIRIVPAGFVRALLAHVDALTAENADLRDKLSAFADGRPRLHLEPGGPTP